MTNLWTLIMAVISGGAITKVLDYLFARKRSNAETKSIEATIFEKLLQNVNKELERVEERDKGWEKLLDDERALRNAAQELNYKYHLEIKTLQAELKLIKQVLATSNPELKKYKVFVVDDLPSTLDMFRVRLGNISLIDFSAFTTAAEFIEQIDQRPAVVVLDYDLENHLTAVDVVRYLKEASTEEYFPKIIITSGHPVNFIKEKLEQDVWKIYSKDGAYIVEVSADIIEYIRELSL